MKKHWARLTGFLATASASTAGATGIASDSYLIGTNPAVGQYQGGVALKNQPATLVNPGFVNGPYASGSGTSNFQATSNGLSTPISGGQSATSGKVNWINAPIDAIVRSNARNLSPAAPASSTYWLSHVVNQGGIVAIDPTGWVLTGFGNATVPAMGTTSGNLAGLFVGFAPNPGNPAVADLVIRYRDTTGATSTNAVLLDGAAADISGISHSVVMKVDVNASGGQDNVTWFLNPTNGSSEANLASSAAVTGSFSGFPIQSGADFLRLNYSASKWNGSAFFDEPRLGTAFTDVTAQKYSWDINGVADGAGGPAPSGNWDGASLNFNSDPTGGGAGAFSVTPNAVDTVTFSAGGDATGAYTINVSGTRTAAAIIVEDGNANFTGGTLAVGDYTVAPGNTATVSSAVTGGPTGSFAKKGAGTLTLTANNTYTGGTSVEAGTLEVTKMHTGNAVNIAAGATLKVLESSPSLPAHPSGNDASVSQPSSLTIAAGGTLDVTNNDVIINYTGGPNPIEALEALVRSGFAGEAQNGPGIISSVAAQDPNYVVGIADNAALSEPFGSGGTGVLFAGVDVPLESVLIKFTHRADLNLDGQVNFSDASIFGTNYQEGAPATWATGDVDLDGVFTFSDAAIFGTYYSESLASLPEPASLGLLGLGVMGLAGRRRNR